MFGEEQIIVSKPNCAVGIFMDLNIYFTKFMYKGVHCLIGYKDKKPK